MDSIFKICKKGACGITVSGLEKDNDEYLNEDGNIAVSTRNYAYSHSITINTLTSIQSNGDRTIQEVDVVKHDIDCIDESDMEMPIDGLYEISHIILPTNVWLDYVLARDPSALTAYNLIYFYHIGEANYYKYINASTIEAVTINEILAINAVPPVNVTDKTSTIIRSDKNTFGMCYITDCFVKMCKALLEGLSKRCVDKTQEISIYNRDLLWMAINVIKYQLELKQFYEAQRILEDITFCGGLCKNTKKGAKTNGCGCSN